MANLKVVNELILLNNNLIEKFSNENNADELEKHKIIASILSDETAFDKMDIGVALNIINDIIKDEKFVFDVYKKIMLSNE